MTASPPAMSEQEKKQRNRLNQPKWSYHQALDAYLVTRAGEITQVATCTPEDFACFIQDSLRAELRHKIRQTCQTAVQGLDYTQLLDRWYAIESLTEARATIALFPTRAAAALQRESTKSSRKEHERHETRTAIYH